MALAKRFRLSAKALSAQLNMNPKARDDLPLGDGAVDDDDSESV